LIFLNPNPTSGALTFAGSLSLYNQLPNPDVPVNLDVSMFDLTSGGTNSPAMYAAYRLNNFNVNPDNPNFPDGEFWAFASSKPPGEENPPGTPIPGAVWLFGTVIAGGVGYGRWRKKRKQAA